MYKEIKQSKIGWKLNKSSMIPRKGWLDLIYFQVNEIYMHVSINIVGVDTKDNAHNSLCKTKLHFEGFEITSGESNDHKHEQIIIVTV